VSFTDADGFFSPYYNYYNYYYYYYYYYHYYHYYNRDPDEIRVRRPAPDVSMMDEYDDIDITGNGKKRRLKGLRDEEDYDYGVSRQILVGGWCWMKDR